jgi:hypothetical protein
MTMKPITDKAEVALEFPDKAYMGSFGRASAFEAAVERDGVVVKLARTGEERRAVEVHLHWYLFADILQEIARGLGTAEPLDDAHRRPLKDAAAALLAALGGAPPVMENSL